MQQVLPSHVAQARPALATPLTSLVGREAEIETVTGLLHDPGSRLITLTGPGGVGKTRIAARVAERVDWFEDGVVAVSLAHLRTPDRLLPAILQATGAPDGVDDLPLRRLASHIGTRHILLVIDNVEQVVPAAPALVELLRSCPRLHILTTSRVALHVSVERLVIVAPFRVPPDAGAVALAELTACDAVHLFVERAQAVQPAFVLTAQNAATIAAICERSDGLPLAIELAASRIRGLTPERLLQEMSASLDVLSGGPTDAPGRLRSLGDAIAWSYNLLAPRDRRLFLELSVFAGTFTLDAAIALAAASGDCGEILPVQTLDSLGTLVESSLLHPVAPLAGQPRFRMLTLVRDYARERLAADPLAEQETRDRHARWCLALERDRRDGTRDRVTGPWLERVEAQYDDVAAALDWLIERAAIAAALELAVVMAPFWGSRGRRAEGRRWLEQLIVHPLAAERPRLRCRALQWAAVLSAQQGDDASAQRLARQLIAWVRELQDRAATGDALRVASFVAEFAGRHDDAHRYALRAIAEFEDLPDHPLRAWALLRLAVVRALSRDDAAAGEVLTEALTAFQQTGSQQGMYFGLILRGQIEQARGRDLEAAQAYLQSLRVHHEVREAWGTADFFVDLAGLAASRHDAEDAAAFLGVAGRFFERSRTTPRPCSRPVYERALNSARVQLGRAAIEPAVARGRRMDLDESFDVAGRYLQSVFERVDAQSHLSERELDVLTLVANGRSDQEIAHALHISRRTASTHVAHILKKLSASSRAEAAAIAVRRGLI